MSVVQQILCNFNVAKPFITEKETEYKVKQIVATLTINLTVTTILDHFITC